MYQYNYFIILIYCYSYSIPILLYLLSNPNVIKLGVNNLISSSSNLSSLKLKFPCALSNKTFVIWLKNLPVFVLDAIHSSREITPKNVNAV